MLRIIKLRIIEPPLVVIFPADYLGRELVRLLLPSTEHFQQFGGIQFADEMMDKPVSFYAFEMLYWCGIREGDAYGKIRLKLDKPSKYKGLS